MKTLFILTALLFSSVSFSQEECKARITEPSEEFPLQVQFTCKPENFTFHVYDQSGKEIFKTDNPDFMWDEKKNDGTKAQEGVYFYVLKCNFEDEAIKQTGHFSFTPRNR